MEEKKVKKVKHDENLSYLKDVFFFLLMLFLFFSTTSFYNLFKIYSDTKAFYNSFFFTTFFSLVFFVLSKGKRKPTLIAKLSIGVIIFTLLFAIGFLFTVPKYGLIIMIHVALMFFLYYYNFNTVPLITCVSKLTKFVFRSKYLIANKHRVNIKNVLRTKKSIFVLTIIVIIVIVLILSRCATKEKPHQELFQQEEEILEDEYKFISEERNIPFESKAKVIYKDKEFSIKGIEDQDIEINKENNVYKVVKHGKGPYILSFSSKKLRNAPLLELHTDFGTKLLIFPILDNDKVKYIVPHFSWFSFMEDEREKIKQYLINMAKDKINSKIDELSDKIFDKIIERIKNSKTLNIKDKEKLLDKIKNKKAEIKTILENSYYIYKTGDVKSVQSDIALAFGSIVLEFAEDESKLKSVLSALVHESNPASVIGSTIGYLSEGQYYEAAKEIGSFVCQFTFCGKIKEVLDGANKLRDWWTNNLVEEMYEEYKQNPKDFDLIADNYGWTITTLKVEMRKKIENGEIDEIREIRNLIGDKIYRKVLEKKKLSSDEVETIVRALLKKKFEERYKREKEIEENYKRLNKLFNYFEEELFSDMASKYCNVEIWGTEVCPLDPTKRKMKLFKLFLAHLSKTEAKLVANGVKLNYYGEYADGLVSDQANRLLQTLYVFGFNKYREELEEMINEANKGILDKFSSSKEETSKKKGKTVYKVEVVEYIKPSSSTPICTSGNTIYSAKYYKGINAESKEVDLDFVKYNTHKKTLEIKDPDNCLDLRKFRLVIKPKFKKIDLSEMFEKLKKKGTLSEVIDNNDKELLNFFNNKFDVYVEIEGRINKRMENDKMVCKNHYLKISTRNKTYFIKDTLVHYKIPLKFTEIGTRCRCMHEIATVWPEKCPSNDVSSEVFDNLEMITEGLSVSFIVDDGIDKQYIGGTKFYADAFLKRIE